MHHHARPKALAAGTILLLIGTTYGQTGPGGILNATDNVLWLRADRGAYTDAGATEAVHLDGVRQWNDASGNGRHAVQATAANRPQLFKNAANGMPALRFTKAENDRMVSTALTSAGRASVWIVARYSSLPSSNPGLLQGSSTGNALASDPALKHLGMWVSSAGSVWGRGIQSDGTTRNVPATNTLVPNAWYVLNANYDGSNILQYVNNAAAGTISYNGTLRAWADVAIGVQGGSEGWNGDIAEVVVFKASLNRAQRIILGNHLAAKYGTTLGAHDIYTQDQPANGDFDHEVAGIGRVNASNLHNDSQGSGIVRISSPSGLNNNEFLFWGHDMGQLGAYGVADVPPGLQGRWGRVWRVSETDTLGNPVDVGSVTMTFDLTGQGPVVAGDLRLLVDTDGDGLFADETPIGGATHVSGSLHRFTAVTALTHGRRFTLATSNLLATPLPVELLDFNAAPTPVGTVALSWSTATEQDNAMFSIERSADLGIWTSVGSVPGAGNSSAVLHYAWEDGPGPGTFYYRLRQMDTDGASNLSPIAEVTVEGRDGASVFPNPANEQLRLRLPERATGAVRVTVLDLGGRPRRTMTIGSQGEPLPLVDVRDLPPGAYVLQVEGAGHFDALPFLVVR